MKHQTVPFTCVERETRHRSTLFVLPPDSLSRQRTIPRERETTNQRMRPFVRALCRRRHAHTTNVTDKCLLACKFLSNKPIHTTQNQLSKINSAKLIIMKNKVHLTKPIANNLSKDTQLMLQKLISKIKTYSGVCIAISYEISMFSRQSLQIQPFFYDFVSLRFSIICNTDSLG